MVRPKICRRVNFRPKTNYFKPRGIPMRDLKVIELSHEEMEVLRLKNIEDLDQVVAAEKMGTSQSTFQRILASAYKKISRALVEGMAIEIKD